MPTGLLPVACAHGLRNRSVTKAVRPWPGTRRALTATILGVHSGRQRGNGPSKAPELQANPAVDAASIPRRHEMTRARTPSTGMCGTHGLAARPAARVTSSLRWGLLSRTGSSRERVRTDEVIAGLGR